MHLKQLDAYRDNLFGNSTGLYLSKIFLTCGPHIVYNNILIASNDILLVN